MKTRETDWPLLAAVVTAEVIEKHEKLWQEELAAFDAKVGPLLNAKIPLTEAQKAMKRRRALAKAILSMQHEKNPLLSGKYGEDWGVLRNPYQIKNSYTPENAMSSGLLGA